VAELGPAAKYFEQFAPGDVFVTQGRTIGEADLTFWTMYTGDMNPMHVDDVYAREHGLFGGRFPAGLMIVAIASGLQERLGMFAGTGLAMTGQTIEYVQAALLGDTIRERMTVTECIPSRKRPAGRVLFDYEIIRQDDTVCVRGTVGYFVLGRGDSVPGESASE
jgi:acyl dehydratase